MKYAQDHRIALHDSHVDHIIRLVAGMNHRYEGYAYNRPVGRGLLLERDRYPQDLVAEQGYYRVTIEFVKVSETEAAPHLWPARLARFKRLGVIRRESDAEPPPKEGS